MLLDNRLSWMFYCFLVIFGGKFTGCTEYKDYYLDGTTDSPDYLAPENSQNLTTNFEIGSRRTKENNNNNLNSNDDNEESTEFVDLIKFNKNNDDDDNNNNINTDNGGGGDDEGKNYLNIENEYNQPQQQQQQQQQQQEKDKTLKNDYISSSNSNGNNKVNNKGSEDENIVEDDENEKQEDQKKIQLLSDEAAKQHVHDLITNHKKQIYTNFRKHKYLYGKNNSNKLVNENKRYKIISKQNYNNNNNNNNYDSKNKSFDRTQQKKKFITDDGIHRPQQKFNQKLNDDSDDPPTTLPSYYYQGQVNFYDGDKKSYSIPIDDDKAYKLYPKNHNQYNQHHHTKHNHNHRDHHNQHHQHRQQQQQQRPFYSKQFNSQMDYKRNYQMMKWPHLSRVELQLDYDDEMNRNDHRTSGQQTQDDSSNNDDNLPPYIKKYNRRSKQLRDLLEGTMKSSSSSSLSSSGLSSIVLPTTIQQKYSKSFDKVNGKHLKHHQFHQHNNLRNHQHHHHHNHHKYQQQQHHRFHNHKNPKWIIEDLFEEQKANPNKPNASSEDDMNEYMNDSTGNTQHDEQSSTTIQTTTSASSSTTATAATTTGRNHYDLIEFLHNNKLPNEDDNFSSSSEDYEILDFSDDEKQLSTQPKKQLQATATGQKIHVASSSSAPEIMKISNAINANNDGNKKSNNDNFKISPNTFIYHRVVDAPLMVGIGDIGKKQKLPFVAITDRRLVTNMQQHPQKLPILENHYPLP